MRYSLIIFLLIFSAFANGPKLVKTKVADGISMSVPSDFKPMANEDIVQRIPSVRAPLAAYTNAERDIDLSVTISATQWPDADHEIAAKFFKTGLMNLFDKVEFISEGIREAKGKKYIYFELESRMNGNKTNEAQRAPIIKYTYIQYLVEKNRTLVFAFNCPGRFREDWQASAAQIMQSVKVN